MCFERVLSCCVLSWARIFLHWASAIGARVQWENRKKEKEKYEKHKTLYGEGEREKRVKIVWYEEWGDVRPYKLCMVLSYDNDCRCFTKPSIFSRHLKPQNNTKNSKKKMYLYNVKQSKKADRDRRKFQFKLDSSYIIRLFCIHNSKRPSTLRNFPCR